jgi:hypothetical protein
LKKIPRKPHPIGQEFKALEDESISFILQLDTISNSVKKKHGDIDRHLIGTLKRLTKPWLSSGRIIIADSWFGSPEMGSTLAKHDLFMIMKVTKRNHWFLGKPRVKILECLDPDQDSHGTMTKRNEDGRTIFTCVYRNLKLKALVTSCSASVFLDKIHYCKDPNM